jgi:TrmH family RNA methyltransferase
VPDSPVITSLQNPLIRHAVKLRDNRFRQREQVVIVDGTREIERALNAGLTIKTLFVPCESPEGSGSFEDAALAERCEQAVVRVSDPVLQKIAFGQNHRDVVAVFQEPVMSLDRLTLSNQPIVIILDGIEKPGNVGAVFRSADAIGADAVVICEGACDLFNPSVIRSSLGTVFSMPCAQADRPATLAWLAQKQLVPVAARVDATTSFWDLDFRHPVAIVIGSEAHGLGDAWRSVPGLIDIRIPMCGKSDSLNASVSAALLMFEAKRQRKS